MVLANSASRLQQARKELHLQAEQGQIAASFKLRTLTTTCFMLKVSPQLDDVNVQPWCFSHQEIYIRNAALYAGDGIINLRRSGPAYVAITLVIPLNLGFLQKGVTLSWKWLGLPAWEILKFGAPWCTLLIQCPKQEPSILLLFCRWSEQIDDMLI